MLNLLPPQQKKEILDEEKWKISLILIIIATFFLTVFFLVLLLINIAILGNLEIQKINSGQQGENPDNAQMQNLRVALNDFNETVSNLDEFYENQLVLTDTIQEMSNLLNASDLYVTDLNFTKSPQSEEFLAQVYLSGFAVKRDSLLDFKRRLEEIKNFQEIDFPPSSWVKPNNINFTASFKIKKSQTSQEN